MKTQDTGNKGNGFCPTRDQFNEWMRRQVLSTLSTLDHTGAPNSATVAFSVTDSGEYLIGTSESSRKSQNIDTDARVAMTVTDPDERMTVQLEAIAEKLSEDEFTEQYAEEHYRQRPESLPFRDEPGQCHILVKPTHIRFSDVHVYPWVITDFELGEG